MSEPRLITVQKIRIDSITIGARKRALREETVVSLAESVRVLGLEQPIIVREDGTLVAGLHRLEACKRLGWESIDAVVRSLSDLQAELAEIDENLVRAELSGMERDEHLHRRKVVYEAMHPGSRRGVAGGLASAASRGSTTANFAVVPGFAASAARAAGISERSAMAAIQRDKGLTAETKELIRGTPFEDNDAARTVLARVGRDPELQKLVARALVEERSPAAEKTTGQSLAERVRQRYGEEVALRYAKTLAETTESMAEHFAELDSAIEAWKAPLVAPDGEETVQRHFSRVNYIPELVRHVARIAELVEARVKEGQPLVERDANLLRRLVALAQQALAIQPRENGEKQGDRQT